jgi:hypothetical protein
VYGCTDLSYNFCGSEKNQVLFLKSEADDISQKAQDTSHLFHVPYVPFETMQILWALPDVMGNKGVTSGDNGKWFNLYINESFKIWVIMFYK